MKYTLLTLLMLTACGSTDLPDGVLNNSRHDVNVETKVASLFNDAPGLKEYLASLPIKELSKDDLHAFCGAKNISCFTPDVIFMEPLAYYPDASECYYLFHEMVHAAAYYTTGDLDPGHVKFYSFFFAAPQAFCF